MRPDICLSIGNINFDETITQLEKANLAEIRMDLLDFTNEQFVKIFAKHDNLIATYRARDKDYKRMYEMLELALDNGAKYVDMDIEVPEDYRQRIIEKAKSMGKTVILSYHNYNETPSIDNLKGIIEYIFCAGANYAKIACMANTPDDCSKITRLYLESQKLIAFCMGEMGIATRLTATFLGAPFTYASIEGKEIAPGQISYNELESILKNQKP